MTWPGTIQPFPSNVSTGSFYHQSRHSAFGPDVGRTFGVDVDSQIASVREALDEHTDYQEQRAEQQMDEYKEHRREERANEDGIREMFGSLRSER